MANPNSNPDRESAAEGLQASLVELIDLALQSKQAHWNVRGRNFRAIHLQLDEIVTDVRLWADEVAERMTAMDVPADGRLSTIAEQSNLEPQPAGWQADDNVIKQIEQRLGSTAIDIRQRMDTLESLDVVSHDLLLGIVQGLEKHQWMVRAQIPQGQHNGAAARISD